MSANVADMAAWPPRPLARTQLDAIWARREEWGRQPTRYCPVSVGSRLIQQNVGLLTTINVACMYEDAARHRWGAWEDRKTADGSVQERQCSLCGQIDRRWDEQK